MLISAGWILISLLIGLMGINRRLGFWVYFLGSIVLSPIVGLLLVFVSGKKATG
jgi:hypothetical protein